MKDYLGGLGLRLRLVEILENLVELLLFELKGGHVKLFRQPEQDGSVVSDAGDLLELLLEEPDIPHAPQAFDRRL